MSGPIEAGGDLERMLAELRSKGWSPEKLRAAREVWEDICHDPMRRGRGGKGLPQNEHPEEPPAPPKPSLDQLLDRTAGFDEEAAVPGEPN